MESLNERWFEAMMSGPVAGTLRSPFTFGRKANIKNGVKNARNVPYGKLFMALMYYSKVPEVEYPLAISLLRGIYATIEHGRYR